MNVLLVSEQAGVVLCVTLQRVSMDMEKLCERGNDFFGGGGGGGGGGEL